MLKKYLFQRNSSFRYKKTQVLQRVNEIKNPKIPIKFYRFKSVLIEGRLAEILSVTYIDGRLRLHSVHKYVHVYYNG